MTNMINNRSLQVLAVFVVALGIPFTTFAGLNAYILLLAGKRVKFLYLLYLVHMVVWDRRTGERGGRVVEWMRRLTLWKYFAAYFPAKMVCVEEKQKRGESEERDNDIAGTRLRPRGKGTEGNLKEEDTSTSTKFSLEGKPTIVVCV